VSVGERGGPGVGRELPYRFATEEGWLHKSAVPEVPQRDYLTFLVGDEEYGIDIERIREIIKVRTITEVPHAPSFVLGVIAVRGSVLPVLDLHVRLRLPPATGMSRAARYLIVRRSEEDLFGLLVDEVRHVVRLGAPDIEPPPAVLSGSEAEFVSGIGRSRGRMVILLNLDPVLRFDVRRRAGGDAQRRGVHDVGRR
jgi:purine-binding chemotaxis protein CheW